MSYPRSDTGAPVEVGGMRVIVARLRGIRAGSALGALGQATAGPLAGDRVIVRVDGSDRA